MIRITLTLVVAILLAMTISVWAINIPEAPEATQEIKEGRPQTPTGCPYGDSIPLDSPKCVAPTPEPEPEPKPEPYDKTGTGGVEQWRNLVSKYDWNVDTVLRIMACESGGRETVVNDNPATGDYSVGLMQINIYGANATNRPSENWLKVAKNNVQFAYELSGGGSNFNHWTCY